MEHKYFHDPKNRKVYSVPLEPHVQETTNPRGRRVIGWNVSALVDVSRADNFLENGRWKFTRTEHWQQSFENIGNRYTTDIVIQYFFNNHLAGCEEITQEEYESLKVEYQPDAGQGQ